MAQVILDQATILHHESKEHAVRALIERCGHSVDEFNEGNKNIDDVCKALKDRESVFGWSPYFKMMVSVGESGKLKILDPHGYVLEIGRQYGDKEPIQSIELWAVSGQFTKKYTALDEMRREVKEELGRRIPRRELEQLTMSPQGTLRKSKVYKKTISIRFIHWFLWHKPTTLLEDTIHDTNNVDIHLSHFRSIPSEAKMNYGISRLAFQHYCPEFPFT